VRGRRSDDIPDSPVADWGDAVGAQELLLRSFDELEDHGERGAVRSSALRPDRAMAHGGERAFDGNTCEASFRT